MGETAREILIEKADTSAAGEIYEIGRLCFSDAWRKETVLHDMEGEQSQYFIASLDGKIVGYGCFWFIVDEGQLVNIGVRPEYRKRGIAALLLERGLEECRKREMKTIFLEVRVSNEGAKHLYEKYGFHVAGLRKKEYDLPPEDGYIMIRDI